MLKSKKKIIIAISGEIASGKNEMAAYIEKKHGGYSYRSSEVLRDILKRMSLPEKRENMQKVSTMIREYFGEDIISHIANRDLKKIKNKIIAINGVRRFGDLELFQKDFLVKLIYIKADPKERYKRVCQRSENSDDKIKTFAQFRNDHKREAEVQIVNLENKADFIIQNNGSKKDFYKKIDEMIKKNN